MGLTACSPTKDCSRSCPRLLLLLVSLSLACHGVMASAIADSAAASPVPVAGSSAGGGGGGGGNPVVQLAGYIKDSLVRTVDGCGSLWKNHKACNQIRVKQKDHRQKLQKQWEFEGRMTRDEMKQRLRSVNGGITYDEYSFLVKGKEDRGKLMNVVFLMWGAPRFLPYALMFYPEMLPSPFAPLPDGSARESGLEKLSRERSNAVMQTLLNLERDAKVIASLSKINIFNRKGQQKQLDFMEGVGNTAANVLATPGTRGPLGAQFVLSNLDHCIYGPAEFSRGEKRLVSVPKSITKGIAQAVEGPNPLNSFLPNFMSRGKVVSHIKKITESDEFLVNEAIDLSTLGTTHLVEACNERLIGAPGRNDDELRNSLSEWLKAAVVQPSDRLQRTGQFYNSNLARLSLLCYFASDGTRDPRSASCLPRLLFQGQNPNEDGQAKKKK